MVIDSQNLNLRQILPIYLRLSGNVPLFPGLEKLDLGRDLWWKVAVLPHDWGDGATTDGE